MARAKTGSDLTTPRRGVAPHLFCRILPSLLAALADPAHPGVRSWVEAMIGQLGHALSPEATPILPFLTPAFRLASSASDPEVCANVFYAIGWIGEAVGHATKSIHQSGGRKGFKPRPQGLNPAHKSINVLNPAHQC